MDERHLAYWVDQQKIDYKHGRLTKEQVKALEGIPDWDWELN